jgi:serine/threonine protein kinase
VCNDALDALVKFYELLERRKENVKECIEIFHKKVRVLLYINNVQIRRILLEKIFTTLEPSSEEMTKERLKQSKTLHLEKVQVLHDGSYAFIFKADYKGCSVAAKCSKLSRKCLLKKYANTAHFSYELQFLRSLRKKNHPNIIQLMDDDHHLECLLLEYVAFGSLRRYLLYRRTDSLVPSFEELILIAEKIAGALDFLEVEGIIHLAMQARNVLIHDNGDVKLTGFQFCRTRKQIKENGVRSIVLKPHFKWMDPLALLYKSVVPRTVLWSFGVFLYELLTLGCEPYSCIERPRDLGNFDRKILASSEARVYVSHVVSDCSITRF